MKDNKVVFLDVDGVLNTMDTGFYPPIEDEKIRILKYIINETKAKIVITSDWRLCNEDYMFLNKRLKLFNIEIFDYTPFFSGKPRGQEISWWLREHPSVNDFVIIDDRNDMEPNQNFLVQTNLRDGLTWDLADVAINILNKN